MPESFNALLSEIAETASSAVHPAGPAVARRRGHQLAVRRRVAASVMSVVLLGGAGGLALALTGNHSTQPAPLTRSGTPTPSASSAPSSPSASASPSSSPTASASASTAPAGATGDLNTIVPGAWTPMSQFPFSSLKWKANMSQPVIHTMERQWFYSCYGPGTLAHLGASGYQEMTYTATLTGVYSSADQVMYYFTSTDAAAQALATIRNDYANCPELTTGTNGVAMTGALHLTEQLDGSYAWLHTYRTANGSPGSPADLASDNHEFFVQRGNVVEAVWFGGGPEIDSQFGDAGFLNSLNASMCVYGGTCPASKYPLATIITATGSTSLALGGNPIEFDVTVTNKSNDTIRNVAPVVSLAHCTCVNTPTAMMPNGVLQLWDTSSNAWKTVFYDAEGTGMDYLLSSSLNQVPGSDLSSGQSVSFKYRVRLDTASADTYLTGKYHVTNGTSAIDVTLVHPQPPNGTTPVPNQQIGDSPMASIPVTVTVN